MPADDAAGELLLGLQPRAAHHFSPFLRLIGAGTVVFVKDKSFPNRFFECVFLLALDEPLGALDALTRISMQKLLEQVWLDQQFTTLLVTHDVAEAVMLADRVIVIEGGVVALDLRIELPRPRQRSSASVAALEGRILDELLMS